MAEAALDLGVNQQNQFTQQNYEVGSLLRQQKMEESNKQANSQRLNTQVIDFKSAVNDRLMSRQNSTNQDQPAITAGQADKDKTTTQDAADSLKQAQQLAKLAANPTVAGVAAAAGGMAMDAIKKGGGGKIATGHLLKTWWGNIIPTIGLTLPLPAIQGWIGFLEGNKIFCKLGEEWKNIMIFKKSIGDGELAAALLSCLLFFLVILVIMAFLAFIINVMTHPLENMKILWDLFKGALDGLL